MNNRPHQDRNQPRRNRNNGQNPKARPPEQNYQQSAKRDKQENQAYSNFKTDPNLKKDFSNIPTKVDISPEDKEFMAEMNYLLANPGASIQSHRQSLTVVFGHMLAKGFDLPIFHKFSEIIAQINKQSFEYKKECSVVAEQSNLFFTSLMEQLINLLRKNKCFNINDDNKKTAMMQVARAIDGLLDLITGVINVIPTSSLKFDKTFYKEMVNFLHDDFLKTQYSICLNDQERNARAFLLALKTKYDKFEETKKCHDETYKNVKPTPQTPAENPNNQNTNPVPDPADEKPPNDFRKISVYPTDDDFEDNEVFLRKNKVKGAYKNLNDYLDTHFRLLREDFYSSIRYGYWDYANLKKGERSQHAFIREGRLTSFIVSRQFVGLDLMITLKKRNKANSITRQFMYGSLLLLSNNKFRTFIVCTVKNLDNQQVMKTVPNGYFTVQVEVVKTPISLGIGEIEINRGNYDIIHARPYFEPYYHVLVALKAMYEMPFRNLIVHCETEANTCPLYISGGYALNDRGQRITVLDASVQRLIKNWCSDPQHTFDKSQVDSIEHAFNCRISCIQGPPGTGKTYVGVHIVRLLLELKKMNRFQGPIFLICFTNHALDQFLCHILKYTTKATRLGGQTQHEQLNQYTIKEKKKNMPKSKSSRHPRLFRSKMKKMEELEELTKMLDRHYCFPFISSFAIFEKHERPFFGKIEEIFNAHFSQFKASFTKRFGKKETESFLKYFEKRMKGVPPFGQAILAWLEILDLTQLAQAYDYDKRGSNLRTEELEKMDEELRTIAAQTQLNNDIEQNKYFDKLVSGDKLNKLEHVHTFMNSEPIENSKGLYRTNYEMFADIDSNLAKRYPEAEQIYQRLFSSGTNNSISLTKDQRWILNNYFMNKKWDLLEKSNLLIEEINQIKNELDAEDNLQVSEFIKNDDIIAVTTTGAAKYRDIIRNISAKIIVVEEAAEVLECHITTALTPKTEQLILIGDHLQLRPSVNSFDLAENFKFDISMFERLVENQMKNVRILTQRRMRPEISELTRLLYTDLADADSVHQKPSLDYFGKNLLFFTHEWPEDQQEGKDSKQNKLEADFVLKFTELLTKCGYRQDQITILSLYTGQLLYLKRETSKNQLIKDVRIATVDNFQGEENDIILLSLVRSNRENKIGFLKIENRVNVALSRARSAMFIFGNAMCIRAHEMRVHKKDLSKSFWLKVLGHLANKNSIVDELNFKCPRHSEVIVLKNKSDFEKCPNGGCKITCGARKVCGHACTMFCHKYETAANDLDGHAKYSCTKNCERIHECGHSCGKLCTNCATTPFKCGVVVDYKHPLCGHVFKLRCSLTWKDSPVPECYEPCKKILECGHKCQKKCFEKCSQISKTQTQYKYTSSCETLVEFKAPCGHTRKRPCGQPIVDFLTYNRCEERCGKQLSCNHGCDLKCFECKFNMMNEGVEVHGLCNQVCKKTLICGHQCIDKCTDIKFCSACPAKCKTRCLHSDCPMQCGEVCAKCIEPCIYQCPHFKCTRKCDELCDRPPCNEPCPKLLSCGHNCLGFCGEDCPDLCRVCDPNAHTFNSLYGDVDNENAKFVKFDCGHCFEAGFLDDYFRHSINYENPKYVKCLDCNQPVLFCMRYQLQIKAINFTINRIKTKILQDSEKISDQIQNEIKPFLESVLPKLGNSKAAVDFVKHWVKQINITHKQVNPIMNLNWILNYVQCYVSLLLEIKDERYFTDFVKFMDPFCNKLSEMKKSDLIKLSLDRAIDSMELFCGWSDIGKKLKSAQTLSPQSILRDPIFGPIQKEYEDVIKELESIKCFIPRERLKQMLKGLKTVSQRFSDVHLRKLEIKAIAKVLGLGSGHWFQCPNGHIYAIGECGGAMQKSKCPECGCAIGGSNHALTQGNSHVGWVDDSARPAWDPQNEQANYDVAMRLHNRLNR